MAWRFLSDEDIALLQRVLDKSKGEFGNVAGRADMGGVKGGPDEYHTPSDVHVARTPNSGILALREETGTGIADSPGSAVCDIYRVVGGVINRTPAFSKTVYNINQDPIGGNRWILIHRDKYGKWFGGTPFPAPSADETGTGTGLGDPDTTPPCGTVTVVTYRYRCELGLLNEYRITTTISHDANGCLTKTTSAEVFVRTLACCDDSCADSVNTGSYLTGTGTGTGTGATGSVLKDCCAVPIATVLYLSGGSLGNVTLTYDGTEFWEGSVPQANQTACFGGDDPVLVRFSCNEIGGTLAYSCDTGASWSPCPQTEIDIFDCGPPFFSTYTGCGDIEA